LLYIQQDGGSFVQDQRIRRYDDIYKVSLISIYKWQFNYQFRENNEKNNSKQKYNDLE
jgi:hypothetical protein